MAVGRKAWNLENLVDFEVAVHQSAGVDETVGREIRKGLGERKFGDERAKRRWGLLEWLSSKPRIGAGGKVVSVLRLMALVLLVVTFLLGVGVIRGMVTTFHGNAALNIWVLLAGTIGVQWLLLLIGLVSFLLLRYWIGGVGWLKEAVSSLVKRSLGKVSPEAWQSLVHGKGRQPTALAWRMARTLQVSGIGFNLGLIGGLFGVLWFQDVEFYWETSLSQFGGDSLRHLTAMMAGVWGGSGLSPAEILELKNIPKAEQGQGSWDEFMEFIFMALAVWGMLPRVILWGLAIWKERKVLGELEFQDASHRKLWRELSRVERTVAMEGMKDGVVLLDVGGLGIPTEELRPFLLKQLRVNPEKSYAVGILDVEEEQEAWAAMRNAPCGVVLLVEAWSLSPKQMTALIERIRREAGEETVLRILVIGDALQAPEADEFAAWQSFVDGLRDGGLECIAFQKGDKS